MEDSPLALGDWPPLPSPRGSSDGASLVSAPSSHGFEVVESEDSWDDAALSMASSAAEDDGWLRIVGSSRASSACGETYLDKALAPPLAAARRPHNRLARPQQGSVAPKLERVSEAGVGEGAEEEPEKPLADVRLLRREGRYHGLEGHTARKGCGCRDCRHQIAPPPSLERDNEASTRNGNFQWCSAVAGDLDEWGVPVSRLQAPFNVTAFELAGADTSYSLERGAAWEELPALLARHTVAAPTRRRLPSGAEETRYLLEPLGQFLPTETVRRAVHELCTHVYVLQRHKPKLLVVVPTEPPERACGEQLKTRLRCRARKVPQEAVVRCNQASAAWDVKSSGGHPLDIDLGAECRVTGFSTQGRHPQTRQYPSCGFNHDLKRYVVEDEKWNFFGGDVGRRPGERYSGPWWMVRYMKDDPNSPYNARYNRDHILPQWVGRYELWARGGGQGAPWRMVGTYQGNNDMTTEVLHSFTGYKGGLRARYLRVVPLETENGGALRVGVYGCPAADEGGGRRRRGGGTEDSETEMITYTLTTGGGGGNARYARDARQPLFSWCDRYGWMTKTQERRYLRHEIASLADADDDDGESDSPFEDEAGWGEGGEEWESAPPAPPRSTLFDFVSGALSGAA